MTCIAGIAADGIVYLGGDSAATAGNGSQILIADKKVFLNKNIAFGICGSPKLLDPLKYTEFTPITKKSDNRRSVATVLVPEMQAAFKKFGCLDKNGDFEGALLLGVCSYLYRVEGNFQLVVSSCGFDAVGSGGDIAAGSLHSTKSEKDAKTRILTALDAAATCNAGVRPPFTVVSTKKFKLF
jgi:ATP-dependent protease HslVU (ClpYQ) peptidase subunit